MCHWHCAVTTDHLWYNIFVSHACCEYHDLTAPGITSELCYINVMGLIFVLRWNVGTHDCIHLQHSDCLKA